MAYLRCVVCGIVKRQEHHRGCLRIADWHRQRGNSIVCRVATEIAWPSVHKKTCSKHMPSTAVMSICVRTFKFLLLVSKVQNGQLSSKTHATFWRQIPIAGNALHQEHCIFCIPFLQLTSVLALPYSTGTVLLALLYLQLNFSNDKVDFKVCSGQIGRPWPK